MRISYSNRATGCGLVFDKEFFKISNSENMHTNINYSIESNKKTIKKYIQLQEVQYLDSKKIEAEGVDESLEKELTEIKKLLHKIFEGNKRFENTSLVSAIREMLDLVRFIFKDKEYDYE